ncbi:hypothetical protein RMCBS344292_13595 [Rhizopus microsporus]|nr:hypothetical protein RMCBS344292_13595 [Rhizopus microsporus]
MDFISSIGNKRSNRKPSSRLRAASYARRSSITSVTNTPPLIISNKVPKKDLKPSKTVNSDKANESKKAETLTFNLSTTTEDQDSAEDLFTEVAMLETT